MTSDALTSYRSILKIRQAAYRRNLIFTGILFLTALLATIVFEVLTGGGERYIYGLFAFDTLFIISFLMTWVRMEITKENIELLDQMLILGR